MNAPSRRCGRAGVGRRLYPLLLAALAACGDGAEPARRPADDTGADRFDCEDFEPPPRPASVPCPDVDASAPDRLVPCTRGSGFPGRWTIDAAGLPAYDFAVEQRCDPVARAWSPRPEPLRDPIHLVGNGRGLVAMARASGAVEVYSQDRGHKWINRVDTWTDPRDPAYPVQLGGGFNYLAVAGPEGVRVLSTRFEDLPVTRATGMQRRRFGVGYYETVTRHGPVLIRRRTFAPDAPERALVAEVTVENTAARRLRAWLVEFWDVNISQVPVEVLTSDLGIPGVTAEIERRRRALAGQFTHVAEWDAAARVATVTTEARQRPAAARTRLDPARIDYFPEPVFLAVLDDGVQADGVWLLDEELWPDGHRGPPAAIAEPATAASRRLAIDGAGQPVLLAIRVPLEIGPRGRVTRRFAFGYVTGGGSPATSVASLRAAAPTLRATTEASWRRRLVWAAFPGLPDAAVVQRELAWGAYNALAHATGDEYRGVRVLGQGGAYKYIHGLDGAMGDLALFAEALLFIDPALARETLVYALATQHGPAQRTPFRYPYATTGVGSYSDVGIYDQRSDAYYFVPAAVARYVATSRDLAFLREPVPFWPRAGGAVGDVLAHVAGGLDYGTGTLGFGARGLVAMGTGDYADGITSLATEPATPRGTSSSYNAGAIVHGFPLLADVVDPVEPALAARVRELVRSQTDALLGHAWSGAWFLRGFVDSGNPLAPHIFFLEPQVLPVLAGIAPPAWRDSALDHVAAWLETPIGAVSNVLIAEGTTGGGPDLPLIGGIWPVANAWLTAAYARRNPAEAWSSFTRNTLAAHAEAYPALWYGIWTGPDSFNGPDSDRPGEADAHLATALTDYPALNTHVHAGPLRALLELVGVSGTAEGLRITPRVPTETFSVVWPRLEVRSTPRSRAGRFTPSADGPLVLEVAVPSGIGTDGLPRVSVDGVPVPAQREGPLVRFRAEGRRDVPVEWVVDAG